MWETPSPTFHPKPRSIGANILISPLLTEDVGVWGSQVYYRVFDPTLHFVWARAFGLLSPDLAS